MWLLILYYFFNILFSYPFAHFLCCYFTFFLLLRSPRDTFYNLKLDLTRLTRFNYNPHLIIITIFHAQRFYFLNWKLSQLKCISLIKLTSTLSTLFSLEKSFFTEKRVETNHEVNAQKVDKELYKKFYCTDILFTVQIAFCTDIYVCDKSVFCFISYNQSTNSDWSEDGKQNKTMNLSVLKSATCEPCL